MELVKVLLRMKCERVKQNEIVKCEQNRKAEESPEEITKKLFGHN
jgi:hypothetical protein